MIIMKYRLAEEIAPFQRGKKKLLSSPALSLSSHRFFAARKRWPAPCVSLFSQLESFRRRFIHDEKSSVEIYGSGARENFHFSLCRPRPPRTRQTSARWQRVSRPRNVTWKRGSSAHRRNCACWIALPFHSPA